ncbi:hypothetical protein KI387_002424, partial [Taxus chinensis]
EMASPEETMDSSSCIPMRGSLSTSSMDMSNKNSLSSSTLTGTNSVKNSNDMTDTTTTTLKLGESNSNKIIENLKNEKVEHGSMSGKSSISRASYSSGLSDSNDSICSSLSSAINKPHKANDARWEAIQLVKSRDAAVGLSHFRLLKRLGCGDIGSVYLAELRATNCYFAMKVMDKGSLASRKKLLRAQTEREILASLDHPFLPTLYTHFETDKFSCLVMEFCSGGDLHTLRQKQPNKHFSESAA